VGGFWLIYFRQPCLLQAGPYAKLLVKYNNNDPLKYYSLGSLYQIIYEEIGEEDYFSEGVRALKKAIYLKPGYFDALYNLGALYYNKASALAKGAEMLNNEEYNNLAEEVNELLLLAIEPFERAQKINPDDKVLISNLKSCYLRTKQADKYMELDK